ncbi:oligosaccharide flippase family protein [Pelagibius litoralis]|uniref:Oligosaccharide flippase family protein n=1 Tax=Pelagibius litoralis TaxID=374515 RepID=A0A967C892_9PROT|nr:oligosaccharide flippase family protein [Pelagibius litoralis]NIA68517.1 oligosaccharide flippase family protein [Pelagibius litoralis]
MTIRKSIAWTFSEQTFQYGLQFAASVIIARLLTPDEMGIFVLAMSAAAVLTSLRTFGVGNYLLREADLNSDKIRSAFGVMLVISWTLGLMLFLGRHWIAALYERPGIAEVMTLLSINFIIAPFGAPAAALLTREMRFQALHNMGLAASIGGALVSVSLAYAGFSYMALAWGMLLSSTLSAVLPMLVLPRHALMLPSFVYWRDITKFGGLLSLATLIGTMNAQGTKFILGGFTGPALVAQFTRATQVPALYRQGIFGPVGRVLTPAWMKRIRDGQSIGPGVEKLVALNTVLVWPVFLALSLIAVPFITLVFGQNWRPAGEIFAWILLAQGLVATLPQPEQILVPHGKVGRVLGVRSLTAAFSLSTAAYSASLGLEAFAISRVLAAGFFIVVTFLAIKGSIDFRPLRFGAIYLRSALVAAIVSVPAAVYHFRDQDTMSLLELLIVIGSSALLWVVGAAATRHLVWLEGMAVWRRFWGEKRLS